MAGKNLAMRNQRMSVACISEPEFLNITSINPLISKAEVKVLPTDAEWFGVTYQEDKASVTEAFRKLIADGVYSEKLYD